MQTNQVVVSGYVGNQPETRLTARQGIPSTRLAIAQTEVFWKDEEKQERTHWFQVICYGKVAEIAVKHISKGARLVVSGRLSSRIWHDQESGRDLQLVEIIASNIEISRWPKEKEGVSSVESSSAESSSAGSSSLVAVPAEQDTDLGMDHSAEGETLEGQLDHPVPF